ncbi:MAG TPA: hypothetical protein VK946_07475 [Methylotenera sp.]|nr:hypothetical protein [Methylotenera sp.]
MKLSYALGFGVVVALIAGYLFYNQGAYNQVTLTPDQEQMIKIGYKCIDFGDRAVAKDTPIVEFQKLERMSKRANVIITCMQDNGYKVNPVWLKEAEPIAKAEAEKNKISFDEAMINISRRDMQILEPAKNKTGYWVKK